MSTDLNLLKAITEKKDEKYLWEAERQYPADVPFVGRSVAIEDFVRGAAWQAAQQSETRDELLERAALEADRGYLMNENCDDIAARIRALKVAAIEEGKD